MGAISWWNMKSDYLYGKNEIRLLLWDRRKWQNKNITVERSEYWGGLKKAMGMGKPKLVATMHQTTDHITNKQLTPKSIATQTIKPPFPLTKFTLYITTLPFHYNHHPLTITTNSINRNRICQNFEATLKWLEIFILLTSLPCPPSTKS